MLILWPSPTLTRRDKLIATIVPPLGLVALFFGLVAALSTASPTATSKITLPLGVAIPLAIAGLAAHLLPPIHLMRTRRRQRSTLV
jgi:hypothetical protein